MQGGKKGIPYFFIPQYEIQHGIDNLVLVHAGSYISSMETMKKALHVQTKEKWAFSKIMFLRKCCRQSERERDRQTESRKGLRS